MISKHQNLQKMISEQYKGFPYEEHAADFPKKDFDSAVRRKDFNFWKCLIDMYKKKKKAAYSRNDVGTSSINLVWLWCETIVK